MSAPFPDSAVASTRSVGTIQFIPERDEFVPPWYVPHNDPHKIVVKQNGKQVEPGFTVADVLPERRWAIAENGELLPRLEFQEAYRRKLQDWYVYASPEGRQGRGGIPKSFVVEREPVPNPADYVAVRLDPRDRRKTLPMGYDPDATRGTRPNRLWDSTNERWIEGQERLRMLTEQYHRDRSKLKAYEVEEVEASLGGRATAIQSETQVRLEELTRLKNDGVITSDIYGDRVAELFGIEPSETTYQPEEDEGETGPKRGHHIALCGTEIPNFQKNSHPASCEKCQEIAGEGESTE